MNSTPETPRRGRALEMGGENTLKIEVVRARDAKRFNRLLGEYHYLGETNPAGDFLRQAAGLDGKWVGLLAWGSACYALRDRCGDMLQGGGLGAAAPDERFLPPPGGLLRAP